MPAGTVAEPMIFFGTTIQTKTIEETRFHSTMMTTTTTIRVLISMTGHTPRRDGIIRIIEAEILAMLGTGGDLPKKPQRRPAEIHRKNVAGQSGGGELAGTMVLD